MQTSLQHRFEKKTTYQIDAFDLEALLQSVYGTRIEMLESANDTTHEFRADATVDEYEQETVQKAIKQGALECWAYGALFNDLCHKGYIKPGTYYVRMSW